MSKRNRQRRPARQKPYKDVERLILVVTEGVKTEPQYLEGFKKACRNPRVHVETIGEGGSPRTVVETARDRKKEREKEATQRDDDNLCYDEVWCVFDVDDHANLQNSKQMARDNGLEIAASNPCFELWLYLHFADQPGMKDRHELQRMMKAFVPEYDKSVDYSRCYQSGHEAAVRRAKRLEDAAAADDDADRNPSTGVWRLTESIRRKDK